MIWFYNKKQVTLLVWLLTGSTVSAQTRSYVQTELIKVSGVQTDNQVNALSQSSKQTSRAYFDGIGRVIQGVTMQGSPLQADMVQPMSYDNAGRQVTKYLPYVAGTTDGSFHPSGISSEQPNYYNNGTADKVADDSSPFIQVVFDNSPLQRVLKMGNIGNGFQPVSGQHYKTVNYYPNTGNEQAVIWATDGTTASAYYTAGTLWVTDAIDEQGAETLSYTDTDGRLVLKRQIKAGSNLDTYYIYNTASTIKYIVPPKAVAIMKTTGFNLSQTAVSSLLFSYVYDNYGRLVEKTIPGAGVMYMVYDPLNRPVLMQDANMRIHNQWNYIKYDVKNRPVSQGIYTDNNYTTRASMQSYVAGLAGYNTIWAESRTGTLPYYTNNVFPTANSDGSALQDLTYGYFDDYDLNADGSPDYLYQVQGLSGEANATTLTRTLPTIVRKRTIGQGLSNIWLVKVMFYDNRYRLIQTQGNNQLNSSLNDVSTSVPDFSGKPLLTSIAKNAANIKTTVNTAFTYDAMNRLLALDQSYNGAPATRIAAYEYNELGQLVKRDLGANNGGAAIPASVTLNGSTTFPNNSLTVAAQNITVSPGFTTPAGANVILTSAYNAFLQNVDYRYNIRNQLLSINNSTATADGIKNSDTNDLFGMELLYDQQDTNLGNTGYYNGMVTGVKWTTKNAAGTSTNERGYTYSYDQLMQLTGSTYAERAQGSTGSFNVNQGAFNEGGITYDENGNITALQRNAVQSGAIVQADNLRYVYDNASNPNRLLNVTDGSGSNYTGLGFRNLTGSTGNYAYDNNGNQTVDPFKGLALTYNVLNRTDKITITTAAGRYITYTYDAGGTLLRKQQYDNNALQLTTDYTEGFVFTTTGSSTALAYFGMPEGRVRNTGSTLKAEYIIKDQQGNARISFEDNGSSVAVVRQENSYYAFGLTMPGSAVSVPTTSNKNLYNGGSEWQNDYADLPDVQQTFYRNYDATLGRWNAADPFAESAESMSIYQYAMNNPIMFNDPMGDKSEADDIGRVQQHNAIQEIQQWESDSSPFNPDGTFNFQKADRLMSIVERNIYQAVSDGSPISENTQDFLTRLINGDYEFHGNYFYYKIDAPVTGVAQGSNLAEVSIINARVYIGGNQGGSGVTKDQYLFNFGLTTSTVETFSGISRLGSNLRIYSATERGGVFLSNQFVKTIGIAKIAKGAGIAGAVVGVGIDGYGFINGTVSGGKFAGDTGMGAFGLTGFGTLPAVFYFGIDAYYPGGFPAAMRDSAPFYNQINQPNAAPPQVLMGMP